mmetsp:Transcript_2849/g.5976  ORF Transcript_2849/g.5976 Transcript_2849/m.5976 type:complete len:232 (-) Transcript_2849:13-708(-)|eukprot:CAMPEP_0197565576 /NCGR_PEP_ID=MMETSP1320-20131121/32411_1 /TAXON_ID=91990 /ORGANISM="Bolidomonas sp., Strain RCC2347" /LENGTH=231 /DNA_ID=CAMNT_0043127579 /DNA_START=17 /DNA_END=712 /DNA_ORIENTATION=+
MFSLKSAAEILFTATKDVYWDRKYYADIEAQLKVSTQSSTVYVGNLAFSTPASLIHSHFAMAGPVSKVIMGINRNTRSPCGFCFVVYEDVRSAREAVTLLSATKLDGMIVRVELDPGFKPGRQFGRGSSGAQVRDDRLMRNNGGGNKRRRDPDAHVMDGALSSGRDGRSGAGHYGPGASSGGKEVDGGGDGKEGGDDKMAVEGGDRENSGAAGPSAKKRRMEEDENEEEGS